MKQIIIDVREDYEFAQSHVNGAINIPPQRLMAGAEELGDVPKDTAIVLYCRSGARSSAAMNILRQQGFTDLTNGINEDHVNAKYLGR